MPSIGGIVSSVIVTSIGVAIIFRIAPLRSLVTGIQTAGPDGKTPANASALYM